ncbi:MAG: hypothetical protein OXU20_32460 [Myxococcales bacterium]|nr:hypothetical protein [Myxococcales bacterium]MDD9968072.1 hypothetical protein [Myxococcales bacterium]
MNSKMGRITASWMFWALTTMVGACASDTGDGDDGAGDGSSRCGELNTEPGPTMRPGQNCLSCHYEGFRDELMAPNWTAAGTVFDAADSEHCDGVEGVSVFLTAEDGSEVELVTNEVGNFWTDEPLMEEGPGPRLEYEGRTIKMARNLPAIPACAGCHANPPQASAPGRIFAP